MGRKRRQPSNYYPDIYPEYYHDRHSVVWDSGIKYIEPVIVVPEKILRICRYIDNKLHGREFAILLKGNWSDRGLVIDSNDFVIPKQKVTVSTVEIDSTELSKYISKYNVVLHSHPIETFSGIDEEYLNKNFLASIVYNNSRKTFSYAVINIKVDENYVLTIPARVIVDIIVTEEEWLDRIINENIETPEYYHPYRDYPGIPSSLYYDAIEHRYSSVDEEKNKSNDEKKRIKEVTGYD